MVSEGVILGLLTLASGALGAGLAWLTGRRADKTNHRKNESEHLQGREQLLWDNGATPRGPQSAGRGAGEADHGAAGRT